MNKLHLPLNVHHLKRFAWTFLIPLFFLIFHTDLIAQPPAVGCADISCLASYDVYLDETGNQSITFDTVLVEPDIVGYISDETIAYNPTDLINATNLLIYPNELSADIDILFEFPFWETNYNTVKVSPHGYISFDTGISNQSTPQTLPAAGGLNNIIAGCWQAYNTNGANTGGAGSGQVFWQTLGSGNDKVAIFEWDYPSHQNGGLDVYFQIHLYEATGVIEVHIGTQPEATLNHTLGLNNADGSEGIWGVGKNNSLWTASNYAIRFTPATLSTCYPSISIDNTDFDCADVGTMVQTTLSATSVDGTTSTCVTNINVIDNTTPQASCQDVTLDLDASGNLVVLPEDLYVVQDNCGDATSATVVPNTFDCNDLGSELVTLIVVDPSGAQTSCTSTVTIEDNTDPTTNCQNATIQLNASGNASLAIADIDAGSFDNCNSVLTIANTAFTCADLGDNTVTLTQTDGSSNTSSCDAVVTVEDNVNPIANCQDFSINLDASGNATIFTYDINNNSSDNCVDISQVLDVSTFDCSNVGANTVELTITDGSDNTDSCTSTVTVNDMDAPVANCQDVNVFLDDMGEGSITTSDINDGSSDICTIENITLDITTFDCSNVGANTVMLTVEDPSGNSASCSATVTVIDDIDPTAICQNITIDFDDSGMASITADQINNGSFDNCAIASISVTPTTFDISNAGLNNVTLTVNDVNGNSSTCAATVFIQDGTDPIALCQDITVQLDVSGSVTITALDVDNGSDDASGIANYSIDISSFDCSNIGPNTVTLTIEDNNGNTASCTSQVTVEDDLEPNALCQNLTIQLDASGDASITVDQINNGSNDNCGVQSTSIDITAFDCSNVGPNTVILSVDDVNGNNASCEATVTVEDNVAPNALCQDLTIQLDASGDASITVDQINNGSNDNCGIQSTSININTFDCSNVGQNIVTLSVADVNGNNASCTATVTVEDNVVPNALCQDLTIQLDASGNASITVGQIDAGSNDNCGIQSTSIDINTFDCSNVGTNTVTLSVADVNGNSASCTATVTVEDVTDPVANCQDATVQLDANGAGILTASDIDAGGSDACGLQTSSIPTADQSWGCADVGIIHTVVLTITDVNGNPATCTSSVTVEDNIDPQAICNDITIQLDADGAASITFSDIDGGSVDACGIQSVEIDSADEDYDCSSIGDNTVTLTVTDVNGNVSQCDGIVTVEDNIAPAMLCQDVTIELDENGAASIVTTDIDAGSSDACGIASIGLGTDEYDYDCSQVGSNAVTLTATDNNGNTATCAATVTVQDNIIPEIICSDLVIDLGPGLCGQIIQYTIETSDNCGVASEVLLAGPASETYLDYHDSPWEVDWEVTDVNGNTNSCSFTVTMNEYANPTSTLVCIDMIQVALDDTGCATIGADMILEGGPYGCYDDYIVSVDSTDAIVCCSDLGGVLSVTVTDPDTGNLCLGNIEVVDELGPLCSSVTDYTINCTASLPSPNNTSHPNYPSFTDNCGPIQIALGSEVTIDDDICSAPGLQIERIWTALDASGNPSQDDCIQIITVERVDVFFGTDATFLCDQFEIGDLHPDFTGYPTAVNDAACMYQPSYSDQILAACGGLEKIVRTWTVLDWCTGQIILVDGNGTTNVQVLEIIDNQAPTFGSASFDLNADATSCGSTGYIQLPSVSDNCTGLENVQMFITDYSELDYTYDSNGNIDGGFIPAPGIALGNHELVVLATDGCGNSAQSTYSITVVDEQAPTPVCHEILQVSVTSDGNIPVFAVSFDDGTHDNCCIDELQVRKLSDPAYADYVVFDCSEVGQTVAVIMEVTDCYDNTNTCMVNVDVSDTTPPTLDVPANTTVTCDQYFSQIAPYLDSGNGSVLDGLFGTATYDDNCSAELDYSYTYSVDDCGDGNIVRFWTVVDPSGNGPITGVQVITVYHVSNWFVTFPGDQTLTCANGELPDSGEPIVYFDNCENIIVGHVDTYYDVVPDACYKIVREWSAINWCTYPDEGPETGTQIIKIIDDEAPIFDVDDFTVEIIEDDCDTPVSLPTPDVTDCSDDITITTDSDLPSGQAGPGTYNVTYTVSDGCGNYSYDQITVTVVDAKNPTPYLVDELVVEIMQTGMTQLINVNDFDIGSFDNCSDVVLSYSTDVTDTDRQFTCDELGANTLEIWVTDESGNQDFATVTLTVQDNMGACVQAPLTVAGTLITEGGDAIDGAIVDVNAGEYEQSTGSDGFFNFELPYGGDYSIAPNLDVEASNGVTTFDMVLITQHILGMNELDTPYQLIAADANNSNSITTLDLVSIRMVILQMTDGFPNNTSWRFVDADHVFADPASPWGFPEVVNYNNIDTDYPNTDFIGVKVGDVNGSVQANLNAPAESRTGSTIYLETKNESVVEGEEVVVGLSADAFVSGLQFTLEHEGLIFESLESALVQEEHIAIHDSKLAISWNEASRTDLKGQELLRIRFTAEKDLNLSNAVWVSSTITKAEAYTDKGIEDIAISFSNTIAAENMLYQNTPNPFNGKTSIRFNLVQSGKAVLTVTNVDGKVIERIEGDFAEGMNTIELSKMQKAGVYYYQLETEGFIATKKMLKM